MNDLPENVLGISATGKITGKDYETVLIPAVKKKLKAHQKVRMLYQLGKGFTGFEMAAMMDDAKLGMKHLSAWDKIAIVSDHKWISAFARFFGYLLACEIRIYKNDELGKAKNWISKQ
jgi:hypothetical protein